jgi:hypothetical protein
LRAICEAQVQDPQVPEPLHILAFCATRVDQRFRGFEDAADNEKSVLSAVRYFLVALPPTLFS